MAAGSHHTKSGFRNPYVERNVRFFDVIKWQLSKPDNVPDYESSVNTLPLAAIDSAAIAGPDTILQATWIGHSTLLVQLDGQNILTDPMFSERCSPVSFAGPRRITPIPLQLDKLPAIDAVVISHNHYDHLDAGTVKAIGNAAVWFVPLGLKEWFHGMGITRVIELDWWEEGELNGIKFVCTPSQHFSGRTPFDRNKALWCSWSIAGENQRFWFAGDTGYNPVQFKEIGNRLGPFDLAAIPIGAYNPEWFMLSMHVNPEQAIQLHRDIKSRQSIGIHWGTFILTDEPIKEPPRLLEILLGANGLDDRAFITLSHGETLKDGN